MPEDGEYADPDQAEIKKYQLQRKKIQDTVASPVADDEFTPPDHTKNIESLGLVESDSEPEEELYKSPDEDARDHIERMKKRGDSNAEPPHRWAKEYPQTGLDPDEPPKILGEE